MKNIESADKFHLSRLLSELKSGSFVIPDFQREFEWNASDVNDLMRSIFQDYYIGTILLWKASDENIKILNCEPVTGHDGSGRPQHIVLDGQQRLTAMYFAFFNPDQPFPNKKRKATFYINIEKYADRNFDEAFHHNYSVNQNYLKKTDQQYLEHWFPLSLLGKDHYAALDWVRYYIDFWRAKLDEENADFEKDEIQEFIKNGEEFNETLRGLLNEYYLTYIELDKDIDISKVCEIFTKINAKGVPLGIFDLLNAILRPHDIYLKELWRDNSKKITFTSDSRLKTYILQIMSIWSQNYCSSKYLYYLVPNAKKVIRKNGVNEIIHLITSKQEFTSLWQSSLQALKKGFDVVSNSNEYGAIKSKFLPYHNLVPVFSALIHHIDNNNYKNKIEAKRKLKLWYWSNVFTNNYSSATESKSAKDYIDMQKWFHDETEVPEIVEEFKRDYRNINFIGQSSNAGARYNAVHNLIVLNKARDWYSFDLPDYSELDDHHIVPNSWGKKNNVSDINSIVNRTLLTPDTNRYILKDKLPNEYIKQMFDDKGESQTREILNKHLISDKAIDILLKEDFTPEDYRLFLIERQNTIYDVIDAVVLREKDVVEIPASFKALWSDVELIEIGLRKLVNEKLSELSRNPYKEFVDRRTKEGVESKLQYYLKKFPSKSEDDFSSFESKLNLVTMGELKPLIVSGKVWDSFDPIIKNKIEFDFRIQQIIRFRNPYAHNNFSQINDVITNDCKAAIAWFKDTLKDYM